MQINTNNYSIVNGYTKKAQNSNTQAKQKLNFGKVIGQRDNLFNAIGMRRMSIVDKISDDAGLDVLIKREYEGDGAFTDHGYIIPAGTNAQPEKYEFITQPLKGDVGWLIPKGARPKTVGDVLEMKDSITVLKDCKPSLGAGQGFGHDHHELSFYFDIMHQLCERSAEKKIIEVVEKRKFDFSNPKDAQQSVELPLFTQAPLIRSFSSHKWENRKNIDNILNASLNTFKRVINHIAAYEIKLEKWNVPSSQKERWVRRNKKELYPPRLFNDAQYKPKETK